MVGQDRLSEILDPLIGEVVGDESFGLFLLSCDRVRTVLSDAFGSCNDEVWDFALNYLDDEYELSVATLEDKGKYFISAYDPRD